MPVVISRGSPERKPTPAKATSKTASKAPVDGVPRKTVIVVAVVVVALIVAAFSITRTIQGPQGKNMGSLGGLPSKGAIMQETNQRKADGVANAGTDAMGGLGGGMEQPTQIKTGGQ